MNITKRYALFNFMGKSSVDFSSLPAMSNVKTIFKASLSGTSWEAWDKNSIFNAFDKFDPLEGYYVVSDTSNPSYTLYEVDESSPQGVFEVTKRFVVQTWNCDEKAISEVDGPGSVYAVSDAGSDFTSWNSASIFNSLENFKNGVGHIVISPISALPYDLFSCCVLDNDQQSLTIGSESNVANGLGISFVSTTGNKLYFDVLDNYDGLPADPMRIFVDGTQRAAVTFTTPYNGTDFVFERVDGGSSVKHCGVFASGRVDV